MAVRAPNVSGLISYSLSNVPLILWLLFQNSLSQHYFRFDYLLSTVRLLTVAKIMLSLCICCGSDLS